MDLTSFDKLNIATCAAQRANANNKNADRFQGEYEAVRCWRRHSICFIVTSTGFLNFAEP
jgi:hypothetical protein